MADDDAKPESGGADPAAVALALGRSGALDPRVAAYLQEQGNLARLQAHTLTREEAIRCWSLRLKLAFEFSVALVLLAVVALLASFVWQAAHDDGLVIEAFSVPPDLAARGFTGQVVATQMLDDLAALQAQSNSARAPGSYANNWGDDIKVDIPETGVSIGELNRYLRQLLGHQIHITGEVVHSGSGLTVSARAGADGARRFSGGDTDFDALVQQAAEAVYARTQPYRYGVHLMTLGRNEEATAFFADNVHSGSASERAWAYAGLFNALSTRHRVREAAEAAQASVALRPDFAWGWSKVATAANVTGRAETALAAIRKEQELLDRNEGQELRPEAVPSMQHAANGLADTLLGDHAGSVRELLTDSPALASSIDSPEIIQALLTRPGANIATAIGSMSIYARELIAAHDLAGARRILAGAPSFTVAVRNTSEARHDIHAQLEVEFAEHEFHGVELSLALAEENWLLARQIALAIEKEDPVLDAAFTASLSLYPPTAVWPRLAHAEAMAGDFAAAHAQIDRTPRDCDLCLRTRGRIDAAQKNWNGAAFWFAEAARLAPSIPYANADWGAMLAQKGDLEGAVEQFTLANRKSPHFADPLEMWGEALIRQNHADRAVAKFEEAETYAPRWGRLYLKWGEALAAAGKRDEAKRQFAIASGLELSPADKSELARQAHG